MSLTIKILFIAILTLTLLIPDAIIYSMNDSRKKTQRTTTHEISQSWSGPQTISGPIISIPYSITNPKDSTKSVKTGKVHLLPAKLNVTGNVKSQKLTRSIYETIVYNADLSISGVFNTQELRKTGIPLNVMEFDKATVTIGIGDLKGIETVSSLSFGKTEHTLSGASDTDVYVNLNPRNNTDFDYAEEVVVEVAKSEPQIIEYDNSSQSSLDNGCMQASINLSSNDSIDIPYSLTMKLKGSESLGITPIGGESNITINGDCAAPSFGGMFIPSSRTVENGKFTAIWLLNSNNRQYPQSFTEDKATNIAKSAVIVNMLVPVDRYQKVARAIKYAIVVILLTFIAVLFVEIMTKHPIHIFQYLLVGLALILFYSLLLSLAEHICFGTSYLIASVMTIGLVGTYMLGVIRSRRIAISLSILLAIIYAFIYVLLCLETFALLTGSIGLFIALAAIMYASLKIKDWNRNTAE